MPILLKIIENHFVVNIFIAITGQRINGKLVTLIILNYYKFKPFFSEQVL